MNDINDQKTAEQQAFSEEIRRRLAEPGSGKPTLEEFKVLVYKDREKRRKKRNALVACIVAAFIVGYLTYDDLVPEVGADKNPKETIQTEDGVIIEDGGYGSSEEADNVWVTEDWAHVEDAKKIFPQLIILEYVPKEYQFKELKIQTIVESNVVFNYRFETSDNEELELEQIVIDNGEQSIEIRNISKKLESSRGDVFIKDKEKMATIKINDSTMINIWFELSEEELIKIVENFSI